jgi:alpha-1,2-mannosyltransferase
MICLCGAISVDAIQKLFFRLKSWALKLPSGTHYLNHSMFIVAIMMFLTSFVGLSRILSLYKNYHAPMDLMIEINNNPDVIPKGVRPYEDINFCVGKDWYRFPTSFFFPNKQFRIRFLKSEFRGMLPAYFSEEADGTKIAHDYFNDMNQENEYMYFDYEKCHFLMDIDFGDDETTKLEPNYTAMTKEWEVYKSLPFINAKKSNRFMRAFYIPVVNELFVKYGNFNILRRIKKV